MDAGGPDTTSCGVRTEGGKGDDVLDTVARIGGKLATSEGAGGEEAAAVVIESSLRELQGVRMTFEALEATKIGRAVNALRKTAPSEQARRLAAALYTGWKALADERLRSGSTAQPPPPPQKADEQGIEKRSSSSLPPPVDAKQAAGAGGPEGNREMMAATSVVVEAAPETKLHLNDGFNSAAATVKKPTCLRIRVINTNAPVNAEPPRVTVARRTAEITEPAPAPAPASNRTARNGGGGGFKSNQQANRPATTASKQGTNAAAKRVSPTGGATPLTAANKPPPATALPKPVVAGSSGAARKRKAEATAVFDEARLAKATARLQERYKELSAAKEKRKTKKIDAISALRKKKVRLLQQRPGAQHVLRCTAAHRTWTKQAPVVPCPPPIRMPRAF